ncbi:MAG: c-type cytochrome biogenesis protein CcmI [Maritimibacter sp.]|nr:c-type cytochrome biogenesis protein CcmI [Maritimibacter sp.]
MIFAWLGVLALLTVGIVVLPLFRRGDAPHAIADTTPAVLMDQLDEVERDLARGMISEPEAKAASLEIKRRILSVARRLQPQKRGLRDDTSTSIWFAAAFVPVVAFSYYAVMGSPEISSLAFADRQTERAEQQRIADLTDQLFDRLTAEPDGGASEGWMLLGQSYYRMGRYADAVSAFETVTARENATSAAFSMLAEALIGAEQGVVTPKAEAAADKALDLDPTNPAGMFYKAIALAQRGEEARAYALLIDRLESSDGFAPWMESFVAQANRIGAQIDREAIALADFAPMVARGPGPSSEDIAAAGEMSAEDRGAFIRSMVDRLASRLEENPEDLDGWLRLANAYTVLGDKAQAIAAYEQADGLLSDASGDDPRRQQINQALSELKD